MSTDCVRQRDSFDDRICDDLCEEVLQYLSLNDKIRLQCVSKQFSRLIFQRHTQKILRRFKYLFYE